MKPKKYVKMAPKDSVREAWISLFIFFGVIIFGLVIILILLSL